MHKKVAALGKYHGDSQFWKCFHTVSTLSLLSFHNILFQKFPFSVVIS